MSDTVLLGPGAEFDAIRVLVERWGARARGIGDDAALVDVAAGEKLVVSTDTSVENVHFRREWLTPGEIGWRATMAALSDLAAMGAKPLGVLTAITVPTAWRTELPGIGDGIGDAVSAAGTHIIGGDLSAGTELSITVTVLGSTVHPLTRAGAKPGDGLWVTGVLGGPLLALRHLLAGEEPPPAARDRFARPMARLPWALGLGPDACSSCIDISDGLVADARHIAAASRVLIEIDLETLPVFPGVSITDAAASGEEYELLVTAGPAFDAPGFTQIGEVFEATDRVGVIAMKGEVRIDLTGGYDHFSR